MAELTPRERLVPSLLDRLTDDDPGQQSEARSIRAESVLSLRNAVLRDLEWLLNTGNIQGVVDLDDYPELISSVLNYGMPNLSGKTVSTVDHDAVEAHIRETIRAFEPRILPNTVRVVAIPGSGEAHSNSAVYQIEATLWGRPMPEALFLRTEIDLELGSVVLKEGGS